MNQLKIYKRNGYEFQIIQRSGNVARAVGRKGKLVIYHVLRIKDETVVDALSFTTEDQSKDKYNEIKYTESIK